MKVIERLDQIDSQENFILTIGNFDGVHKGHCYLLNSLRKKALAANNKLVVMSFWPHPKEVLSPKKEGFLLNSRRDKINNLEKLNVDYFCEVKFNRDFSTQTPEGFLQDIIFSNSNLREFYLGYDFSFGANRSGGYDLAKKLGEERKIEVYQLDSFENESEVVSSSLIRRKITDGEMTQANSFLGYRYALSGLVVKGKGRGKTIGFPTANIQIDKNRLIPSGGVYITKSYLKGLAYHSVTNIGHNPTFGDLESSQVETHLIDFDVDIYGEELKVEFIKRIRQEVKFKSVNDLLNQISLDVESCRNFFKSE